MRSYEPIYYLLSVDRLSSSTIVVCKITPLAHESRNHLHSLEKDFESESCGCSTHLNSRSEILTLSSHARGVWAKVQALTPMKRRSLEAESRFIGTKLTEVFSGLGNHIGAEFHDNPPRRTSTNGDIEEYFRIGPINVNGWEMA